MTGVGSIENVCGEGRPHDDASLLVLRESDLPMLRLGRDDTDRHVSGSQDHLPYEVLQRRLAHLLLYGGDVPLRVAARGTIHSESTERRLPVVGVSHGR